MDYAQALLHRIDDYDFTADVTVDHFHRFHDEKIRIGPAQIQVHSHVYSFAKRLIKTYPNMYNKLRHGSSFIGSALDLLYFALHEMEDTPLSSVTEALILKWSGPIKAAHQLGMQVDFASAHLRTVTEAYLGSLALAAAPPLDASLLKSKIEKKEQAIAALQQDIQELQRQLNVTQTGPTPAMRQKHLQVHSQFHGKNVGLDLL
ncbi:hypothetical protein CCACVL1_19688 [Corchorus capsularis]|uniref:Uncharacterized protein n=1 Tax=Corchorus capsularis TaxID=210143 RepID=A0A1R3HFD6_COCAP|nr:hypothetical protein CCACVL1_19688 [Corchorus capsularis]